MKHLSPFRYPGGKSWLASMVRNIAQEWYPERLSILFEPFCGGGSIALDALCNDWADKIAINDLHQQLANFWAVLFAPDRKFFDDLIFLLEISKIETIESLEEMLLFEHVYSNHVHLESKQAFYMLLRNRVAYQGIYSRSFGALTKCALDRWNPTELKNRLLFIREKSETRRHERQVYFDNKDFVQLIYPDERDALIYFDPPYEKAGRQLYCHNKINAELLFSHASQMKSGVVISYEEDLRIERLAKALGFEVRHVVTPQKKTELLCLKEPRI